MRLNMNSLVEVIIHVILFVFFMSFFGIPALTKYRREETITISSLELTHGILAPTVTLIGVKTDTSTGWNRAPATSGGDSLFSFSLFDHCQSINVTDLETCILSDSLEVNDYLLEAGFGIKNSTQPEISWTEDMAVTVLGRSFTWNPKKVLTPSPMDIIFFAAYKNFTFYVFVHDENYFFPNINPLGPPTSFWQFRGESLPSHYQEITLTKHRKLNLVNRPCEEEETYSFTACVKESLSKKVGCRPPWVNKSGQERKICSEESEIKSLEQLHWFLMQNEVDSVVRKTGCRKPCSYKEYKFANSNPREIVVAEMPRDQIGFALWAVSQNTNFEEEVLLYPFTSLLAEFGGSLGLFCGFSFVTIWDGLKGIPTWIRKSINHF